MRTIEDRNRTSHAYIEALAERIFQNIPSHAEAFRQVLQALGADGDGTPAPCPPKKS
jgi:hypothetical protein